MKHVTKKTQSILNKLQESAKHWHGIHNRIVHDCENLPQWFKDKSADYYLGCLESTYGSIETILNQENAYSGFNEYDNDQFMKIPQAETGYRIYYYSIKPVIKAA